MAYIKLDDAKEAFDNSPLGVAIRMILDGIPTADVVKVKHGKWIKRYEKAPRYACSVCSHLYNNKEYKHCPFCGSIMYGTPKESEVQGE